MHPGSKDTYETISNWAAPNFFYSQTDGWHRMGILGPFVDYILSSVQGDISEIGVGESSIYLSHLARKYNRKISHCDIAPDKIRNPLTIAGYLTTAPQMFESNMLTVDNSTFYAGASDDFFNEVNPQNLAFSFIDGDHNYSQATRDFHNYLGRTVENGWIALHDTYPPSEEYLSEHRCGDVYKLRQEIEKDKALDSITLTCGTAMGVGITFVRKKPKQRVYYHE